MNSIFIVALVFLLSLSHSFVLAGIRDYFSDFVIRFPYILRLAMTRRSFFTRAYILMRAREKAFCVCFVEFY